MIPGAKIPQRYDRFRVDGQLGTAINKSINNNNDNKAEACLLQDYTTSVLRSDGRCLLAVKCHRVILRIFSF